MGYSLHIQPASKRYTQNRMKRGVLVALAILTGLAVGWAAFERYHHDRVFAGVEAAGVAVGGLTLEEAALKIALETQNIVPPQLTLKAGDKTIEVPAAELGWKPDPGATAQLAFAVGREGFSERIAALRGKVQIPLVPRVDAAAIEKRLQQIAQSLEYAPVNARVVFKHAQYVVRPDRAGMKLDIDSAIETYVRYPEKTVLEFFPRSISPDVTASMLKPVARKANDLLRPITLVYTEPRQAAGAQVHRRTLGVPEVAALLSVQDEVKINPAALNKVLAEMAKRHDRLPVDARYTLGPEGRLVVQPEAAGWKLNQPETRQRLRLELLRPDLSEFVLTVVPRPALVRAASLPRAEDLQLLAEATTYYAGSPAGRIVNVHKAARRLDGYVVLAGGVFNFNQAVGEISPENGFKEAMIISGGRTVMAVGGGVCQVSTTALRALYRAGLPILERHAHSYRVRWYDNIVGFDSAVYEPYLNLRSRNDTPGPLVVRSTVTRTTHTVRIYGIPDGRQVTVSQPVILSRTPHPPPLYIEEPSLRPGEVRQVDWAVDGFRTRITRTITRPDGKVDVDVLNTNFRPWRAVFQVGPEPAPAEEDEVVSR